MGLISRIINSLNKCLFNLDYEISIIRRLPTIDKESIIIYHMGKVGSTSIHYSLETYSYLNAVVNQIEILNPINLNVYGKGKMLNYIRLKNRIDLLKKKGKRFKIITLTRDPVGYCFSAYFQDFFKIFPYIKNINSNETEIVEKVKKYFLQQLNYYIHGGDGIKIDKIVQYHFNNPLTFFDIELKYVFDIDVY